MRRTVRIVWLGILTAILGTVVACGAQRVDAPAPSDIERREGEAPGDSSTGDAIESVPSDETTFSDVRLREVGVLDQPVDVAARSGDDAVYFVSRRGIIWRMINDSFEADPVLDISDLTDGDGERGLLGLAFSLDGTTAYVNYTDSSGDSTIASLSVDSSGKFDRTSLRILLTIEQPFRNHNAGDLVVEPSGTLLVPMGDGGSADDPQRLSLADTTLLGKVVRLNPRDGSVSVVAKGLRNPWRVDLFDDRLWLADVGQNKWEEVSVLDRVSRRVGAPFRNGTTVGDTSDVVDFGWSAYEANMRFNDDQSSPNHLPPVLAYEHGDNGCSISGGAVATSGSLRGRYVFGDYCSGRVWSISTDDVSPNNTAAKMLLHFENIDALSAIVRAHSDIYVLSLSGTVWRLDG